MFTIYSFHGAIVEIVIVVVIAISLDNSSPENVLDIHGRRWAWESTAILDWAYDWGKIDMEYQNTKINVWFMER